MNLSASVIQQQWNELAGGLDLDRRRLLEQTKPLVEWETLPEKMSNETLDKIKAASVQIGEIGEKPSFSGVIVPNGYVITCAHHHRLPGTKLNVLLADGRSVNAIVLNANWLVDISVLKITDEEACPCVDLGYSSRLSPGESVLTVGYPHRNDQKAIVLETRLIEPPKGSIKFRESWGNKFNTDAKDEEVAKGLSGLSGGGVFDSAGNVIGIHQSRVSAGAGFMLRFARVELFHKNWAELVIPTKVEEIDPELFKNVSPSLNKLMSELSNHDPRP